MDPVVLAVFFLLAAAATYVATASGNTILGLVIFGSGIGVLLVLGGAGAVGGWTDGIGAFLDAAGIPGLLAAGAGAVAGYWAAQRQRAPKAGA